MLCCHAGQRTFSMASFSSQERTVFAGGRERLDVYVSRSRSRSIYLAKEAGYLNTWRVQAGAQAAAQAAMAAGREPPARIARESRTRCTTELGRLLHAAKAGITSGEVQLPEQPSSERLRQFKSLTPVQLYEALTGAAGGSKVEECLEGGSSELLFQLWSAAVPKVGPSTCFVEAQADTCDMFPHVKL
jgi:hypothetical protein